MTDSPPSTQPAPTYQRKYGRGHKDNPNTAKLIAEAPHIRELFRQFQSGQTVAKKKSLRSFGPKKPFDQGQCEGCVGHAFSGAITCSMGASGAPLSAPPSMCEIYTLSRCIDRANPEVPLQDEGTDPNSAILAIATYGVTLMADPDASTDCDLATINNEPKLDTLEEAADLKFKGVYQIPVLQDVATTIVRAIDAGFAVNIAKQVGQKEEEWTPDQGPIGPHDPNDPTIGGHDMYIDGYEILDDGTVVFDLVNSWGTGWGDGGYAIVNTNFLLDCMMAFVVHLQKVAA